MRGLYFFAMWALCGAPLQICYGPRFFLQPFLFYNMIRSDKNRKYADLVVPFVCCPFKKEEGDCPFKEYWDIETFENKLKRMDEMEEEELMHLRKHHRKCLLKKLNRGELIQRF